MICETCKKEMKYFVDGPTCGWKCDFCDTHIVTSYTDEIEFDDSIYIISILPVSKPSAVSIKNIAKICNCPFNDAKQTLINGKTIGEYDAKRTREILKILQYSGISYSSSPEFTHAL